MRARTTALVTFLFAVALAFGAMLLVLTLDRAVQRSSDDLARGRLSDLTGLVSDGRLPSVLGGIGDEGIAQVFSNDGEVLSGSSNVADGSPITAPASSGEPRVRTVLGAPDDDELEDYRVWVVRASSLDGPVTVVVGSSLEATDEASRALRLSLLVGVPLLVALVAVGTWSVVGRTLRPVEAIRSEVERIGDDGRRVPVPRTGDEVALLAMTMNQMLDRLEEASRRQRDFVADASHELQSPLSAMRAQLEVGLATATPDWPSLTRRMLADTGQMERLVRDLLFLARVSEDDAAPGDGFVDLDDVVLEEAARARSSADVDLDTSAVSAAPVRGSADELRRLVRNLVENAARHATTTVRLSLAVRDGRARLDVVDDGAGVAADDRGRVFDRFYTSDGARRRRGGSGLGLSIARSIAIRHGGTLVLLEVAAGAHFRCEVPQTSDEPHLVVARPRPP